MKPWYGLTDGQRDATIRLYAIRREQYATEMQSHTARYTADIEQGKSERRMTARLSLGRNR